MGGSETAAYYVAKELAARGHEVLMFTGQQQPDGSKMFDGVEYRHLSGVERYVTRVPHDVLIVQRDPGFLNRHVAAKVVLWWTHDLARMIFGQQIQQFMWNVDAMLCVSEWHAKQVAELYHLPEEMMDVLPNAIDPALFYNPVEEQANKIRQDNKWLVYSSRPERGLSNLVGPGGIMEKLAESMPEVRLKLCGYDYTTEEMRPMYEQLWAQAQNLPNVDILGPLSKKDLASLMKLSWLHVYPSHFEETSCITAMEQSAAGTPFVACRVGALPETLDGGGVAWVDYNEDGTLDHDGFIKVIQSLAKFPDKWQVLHEKALAKSKDYRWSNSVDALEATVTAVFEQHSTKHENLFEHYLHHDDIVAAKDLAKRHPELDKKRLKPWDFAFTGKVADIAKFYEDVTEWEIANQIDMQLGNVEQLRMPRFAPVADAVSKLPAGSKVLDYGCGPGHLTIAMANTFPDIQFYGTDISEKAIDKGQEWLKENLVDNATLYHLDGFTLDEVPMDLVIASEVLEHNPDPGALADSLESYLKPGGRIVATVPYGPWESLSDRPFRMHLHHLELEDIKDLFGSKPGIEIKPALSSSPLAQETDILGSYVVAWEKGGKPSGKIDYTRKHATQAPRETLSVCMIVKDDGDTLAKTLKSVQEFASEFIVGIDTGEEDHGLKEGRAWEIAESFGAQTFPLVTPIKQGFDSARNETIKNATKDWILWIDDDEVFMWPRRMGKYLRRNHINAYMTKQHHFAAEPAGVIKTDLPCRFFRNNRGIEFYGIVHEHPEVELNKGVPNVMLLEDIAITHNGYDTEETRRKRFARNWPLMLRDREKYPTRQLGRFLWVRDLVHIGRYALEKSNGNMTQEVINYAQDAVKLWREFAASNDYRMTTDSLPYYSEAVNWLTQGQGIDFAVSMGSRAFGRATMNGQMPPPLTGKFMSPEDVTLLTKVVLNHQMSTFEGKYQ